MNGLFWIAIVLALITYVLVANHHIQVSVWEYSDVKLPDKFEGFSIVHLSDIHGDLPANKSWRILEAVRRVQPDIVVITGDVVDHVHNRKKQFERAQKLMKSLGAEFECYYVTGNHEYMHPECESMISYIEQHTKIRVLHDTSTLLEREGQYVRLWGLDDPYAIYKGKVPPKYSTPKREFKEHLKSFVLGQSEFHILLSHRPEFFEEYVEMGFQLVFTGHAHGGQFRGPFGLCAIAPDQGLFPRLTQKKHCQKDTTMYISRGLGNSVVPVRLFNDPEIIMVKLLKD